MSTPVSSHAAAGALRGVRATHMPPNLVNTNPLRWSPHRLLRMLVVGATVCLATTTRAQDIEPRAYANAPVGFNFLVLGYAYTQGGVSFNPSLPITDPQLNTSSAVAAYARAFALWGKSSKLDVIVPYTHLSGSAVYRGETVERRVSGFANPAFRLTVNFLGAPALGMQEFANYQQDLIVGASLRVAPPWGQYDDERLVNIGTNRWTFKPEVGLSKAWGPWVAELALAATLFTDNDDFYGGNRLSQRPLYSTQGHLIYSFRSGVWVSVDATHYTGATTSLNGASNHDLQRNWRSGATLSLPIDRQHSIKLYASSGVTARTGNDFDLIGLAYQYRWAGGH